jgi:hypothetical protein
LVRMERKNDLRIFSGIVWMLLVISLTACNTSQNYFQKEYKRVWQETTHSTAWINSLNSTTPLGDMPIEDVYSPTGPDILATMKPRARERAGLFVELYDSYVSRAYYSLISEAIKADQHLLEEYNKLLKTSKNRPDRAEYTEELALAKLAYEAHWKMLEGLKSWNAFSEYGSDDLNFFKQEHLENAYLMFSKGSSDTEIINFLVYRLADLYHFEE